MEAVGLQHGAGVVADDSSRSSSTTANRRVGSRRRSPRGSVARMNSGIATRFSISSSAAAAFRRRACPRG